MTAKHDFLIEGSTVRYKCHVGIVDFICNSYVTILIKRGHHRSHDVNLLIFPEHYDLVELIDSK